MSEAKHDFDSRFQEVVAKMRSNRVITIVAWTAAAIVLGLIVMATLDYFFEIGWALRAVAFLVGVVSAILTAAWKAGFALRFWNRNRTAAKVEKRFLDLGQSVRTSVQFSDQADEQVRDAGVSQGLVKALQDDVQKRTEDLRLGEAVSSASLKIATVLSVGLAIVAIIAAASSWGWQMALRRSLLDNSPYTAIQVHEGDVRVDEKASLTLTTDITGRTNREIKLLTRDLSDVRAGDSDQSEKSDPNQSSDSDSQEVAMREWTTRLLGSNDEIKRETRLVSYQLEIPKVKKPFEYQFVAGKYTSPIHRIDVRYPLAIQEFDITVTAPDYTKLDPKSFNSGSFDGVQGSFAELNITLDHEPTKAWLELRSFITPPGETAQIEKVALEVNGRQLSTELELTQDRIYQVFAKAADGTELRPNRFRIRVREDQPPKVSFRKPDQVIEVHALAEILMRLKATDDYGLTRIGIRMQKNNDDEFTFEDLEIDNLVTEDGRITPQTQKQIEKVVPLEYLELELKDSISYYGFAADNHPDGAQPNETDLHFVDVRPFREKYPMPEPGQGLSGMGNDNGGNGRRILPALNQMIQRERFAVNRTRQFHRNDDRGKTIDPNAADGLIGLQNETSEFAGLLGDAAVEAEASLGITEDGRISDLFYAAQTDMLASIDSLATMDWEVAELQEKDALQHLLNARTQLEQLSSGGGGGGAFSLAFRRMRQRLRKPKSDRERAREVVRRLKQAAAEQDFLMDKISDLFPPEQETEEGEEQEEQEQQEEEEEEETGTEPNEEADEDDDEPSVDEMRRELEREQLELSEEVDDIADLIGKLNGLTPLAQRRTERATTQVNSVLGSIERSDATDAMESAALTSQALRQLASNISGTTADEATSRLAVARDLGLLLTDDLQTLKRSLADAQRATDELDLEGDEATQKELEFSQPLSLRSEAYAETAQTIKDILDSITDPELGIVDSEDVMVKRLQEITAETKFPESVTRMQKVPETIDGLDWSEAGIQVDDLRDRFDIVSQRLDAIHREILAPRVEQLRKLEKRAVTTRNQLNETQFLTKDQVDRWHIRAGGLLDDIATAEVAEAQVKVLRSAVEASDWKSGAVGAGTGGDGKAGGAKWGSDGESFTPPSSYATSLDELVGEIQRYIRELSMINADVVNTGAIPPKYKPFVERYFEVMSGITE